MSSSKIWVKCENCKGKGLVEFEYQPTCYVECPVCHGRGGEYVNEVEDITTYDNTTLPFEPTEEEQADEEAMDEETMQLEAETAACEEIEAGGDQLMEWDAPSTKVSEEKLDEIAAAFKKELVEVPDSEVEADPLACPNEGCGFVAANGSGAKVHAHYCKYGK